MYITIYLFYVGRCDGEPDCFLGDDEDGCEGKSQSLNNRNKINTTKNRSNHSTIGKQIRCNNETVGSFFQ